MEDILNKLRMRSNIEGWHVGEEYWTSFNFFLQELWAHFPSCWGGAWYSVTPGPCWYGNNHGNNCSNNGPADMVVMW